MDDTFGATIMGAKTALCLAILLAFGLMVSWVALGEDRPGSGGAMDSLHWLTSPFGEPGPPAIGELGHVVQGKFEVPEQLCSWLASEADDFVGVDPKVLLHGQVVREADDLPLGPPATLWARIQSFRSDGISVSAGVRVRFHLITSDAVTHTYRSEKPLILMHNAGLEGEWPSLIAIYSDGDCWTRIVAD